jgi:hypothetical protein
MTTFEKLEKEVLDAQRLVDVMGWDQLASSVWSSLLTLGLLPVNPKPDTSRREIVAMPDGWLKELAALPDASRAGLDYLARYAGRYGFVSIRAASRWLDIENAIRGKALSKIPANSSDASAPNRTPLKPAEGLALLMGRASDQRADYSVVGVARNILGRSAFEMVETVDAWRRANRIRRYVKP